MKTLWNIVVIGGLILTLTYWEGARKFVKKAMITLRDLAFGWIYLFQLLKAPKGQPSPTSGEAAGTSSKESSKSSSKFKRGRSIDEN